MKLKGQGLTVNSLTESFRIIILKLPQMSQIQASEREEDDNIHSSGTKEHHEEEKEKKNLWGRAKNCCQNRWENAKEFGERNKPKIIAFFVVLALLAILTSLLVVYLRRQPEVIEVSDSTTTKFVKNWEETQRYFFNISGITFTGRKNEGRSSATMFWNSYSYPLPTTQHRLLQDTIINFEPYDEGTRLLTIMPSNENSSPSQKNSGNWRPYGFIDGLAENRGLVLRGLNPENRIYYVDFESLVKYSNEPRTATSRLLTAQHSQRILTETEGYFVEILAKEIAELEGVALDRIIVKKEEVWVGTLNAATGTYTISTAPKTTTTNTSLTADQKKAAAQALYDNVLKAAIEEKKNQLQDYGAVIADYFGFSFDRYTDLYITYQQATTLGSDSDDEVTVETNSTNSTKRLTPRRPIIISKVYEPVYGNRPARLKEGKTISRETYEEILACVDYNETTKACSIDEWLSSDAPYKISSVSLTNQANFSIQTRYRVSVKPLPADQVKQEPYETFDPEEMYKNTASDDDANDRVVNMQAYTPPASSNGN